MLGKVNHFVSGKLILDVSGVQSLFTAMSSFSGASTAGVSTNPDLQLAPPQGQGPDFPSLARSYQKTVADCQSYVDQCTQNYQVRYALWNGQSADGKKHAREGSKIDPTPWDGASDLRVYLADNIINKKVAMVLMAIRKANLVAVPVAGGDVKREKLVANFMRWLVRTQIPGLDREEELLANYIYEKGVAITGQFWEKTQEKRLEMIDLTTFQQEFPDLDFETALQSGELDGPIISVLEQVYGVSTVRARRMIGDLKEFGRTTVAVVGREKSYPVIKAFNLDSNVFIPPQTTDIEQAAEIWRVEYFTPEKLRSLVNTDGWNADWVEAAIETCRGQLINLAITDTNVNQPFSRSFIYTQQRFSDLIGVVYGYQRLSDEDGIPGIYLTIFNPNLPPDQNQPGYAKFGLYGDAGGAYPFVLHRREFLSRKIHDSRGIPEPLRPYQEQIKAHRDGRIDTASYNINPTLFYPLGRPPNKWGAGARVPERRPNEYHYGIPIPYDESTLVSEDKLNDFAKDYVGFGTKDADPAVLPLENQVEVEKWLSGWAKAYNQVWKQYQRFGSPEVYFRVIGFQEAEPTLFKQAGDEEEMEFYLSFDVQSMDFEQMNEKFKSIDEAITSLDRDGTVNYSEYLQIRLDAIDPNISQRILQPVTVGQAKVVDEVQGDLTKIAAGINVNARLNTPPQIALDTIQNYMQSPDVQARYQADESFRERLDAYAKQMQMIAEQQQNAVIGRRGAIMPGPVIGTSA